MVLLILHHHSLIFGIVSPTSKDTTQSALRSSNGNVSQSSEQSLSFIHVHSQPHHMSSTLNLGALIEKHAYTDQQCQPQNHWLTQYFHGQGAIRAWFWGIAKLVWFQVMLPFLPVFKHQPPLLRTSVAGLVHSFAARCHSKSFFCFVWSLSHKAYLC